MLYEMHYRLHYLNALTAYYLVGICTMLSFAFYTALILWFFHSKRLRTVRLGLAVSILIRGALVWLLLPGGGA